MNERAWVLLVTDGTTLEAAPEVYVERATAMKFAHNWAWFLSARGEFRIDQPSEDRLQIGQWDVRVVEVTLPLTMSEIWVGTHWTEDGYPDPEAILLPDRQSALDWAAAPLGEVPPDSLDQSAWHVATEFRRGRDEIAYSVAYVAKLVGVPRS